MIIFDRYLIEPGSRLLRPHDFEILQNCPSVEKLTQTAILPTLAGTGECSAAVTTSALALTIRRRRPATGRFESLH